MSYNVTGKAVHDIELGVQQYGYDSFTKVILMKQNDINSHVIHAKIKDNNSSLLASEATKNVKLVAKLPNSAPCVQDGTIENNDIHIEIAPSMLQYAGKVECEVQVIIENEMISASYNRASMSKSIKITEETFKKKIENKTGKYIFEFDGTNWVNDGSVKTLSDYGIAIDNTPEKDDEIVIYYSTANYWKSETFYISVVETVNEYADILYCKEIDSIQLGFGLNEKPKTLQVYDDNIYDANAHCLTVKNIELSNEFRFVDADTLLAQITANNEGIIVKTAGGNIVPNETNTISLGTALKKFKNLYLEGFADIAGLIKVGGTAEITGATTLKNTLSVAGKSSFNDDIEVNGNFVLSGNSDITGTLNVTDTTELAKRLTALTDIIVGDITSNNLQITNTGISAKSNGTNSGLYLNDGGGVIGFANGANGLLLTPDSNLAPSTNNNLSLGTVNNKFKDLYLAGLANISGSLTLGGNATISGITTFNNVVNITGNLTIKGDITQEGTTYETHAEQVYSTKDYIYLREGNTGALTDGSYSGLQFVKYDGTNDGRLVIDKNGVARVGDVGDEQPIATREEAPTTNGIAHWDNETQKFITSGLLFESSSGLIPSSTNILNLGADAVRFKDLYLSGNAYFVTPNAESNAAVGATTAWVRTYLASQAMGAEELAKKVDIAQGSTNANKVMVTDESGNITPSSAIQLNGVKIQSDVDEDGNSYIEFIFPDEETA